MKIFENLEQVPLPGRVRNVDNPVIFQGRKVQKIEYDEFISWPERFGKGLVAFLTALFTAGLALYFFPTLYSFGKEAIQGYGRREGYLAILMETISEKPQEQPLNVSQTEQKEEAGSKITQEERDAQPKLQQAAELEEKRQKEAELRLQQEAQLKLQQEAAELEEKKQKEAERKEKEAKRQEINLYEQQFIAKLAGEIKPGHKISELSEIERKRIGQKILSAISKIKQAWIRSKIPSHERREAIKNSMLISLFANKWSTASIAEIQAGTFDHEVKDCVKACVQTRNRWGLLLLANALFSRVSRDYTNLVPFHALKAFLYDELSSLKDMAIVFDRCFMELKGIDPSWVTTKNKKETQRVEGRYWTRPLPKNEDDDLFADEWFGPSEESSKIAEPVKENPNSLKSDEKVAFSHGGGFFHLLDILRGRCAGYRLEGECGNGLQVHPRKLPSAVSERILEREIHDYAIKAIGHFDFPVRVLGESQAQFIEIANNGYEGGIHAGDLRKNILSLDVEFLKIGNKDITPADLDDPLWVMFIQIDKEKLESLFPDNPELRESILTSFYRLRPNKRPNDMKDTKDNNDQKDR